MAIRHEQASFFIDFSEDTTHSTTPLSLSSERIISASVQIPATGFAGTTLSFETSNTGATAAAATGFTAAQKDGSAITAATVAASVCVPVPEEVLASRWWRILTGTAQTADVTLNVSMNMVV